MIDELDILHVYPINDEKKHKLYCEIGITGKPNCKCECKPMWQLINDTIVMVHNSFDGREGLEWANEILLKQ